MYHDNALSLKSTRILDPNFQRKFKFTTTLVTFNSCINENMNNKQVFISRFNLQQFTKKLTKIEHLHLFGISLISNSKCNSFLKVLVKQKL